MWFWDINWRERTASLTHQKHGDWAESQVQLTSCSLPALASLGGDFYKTVLGRSRVKLCMFVLQADVIYLVEVYYHYDIMISLNSHCSLAAQHRRVQ